MNKPCYYWLLTIPKNEFDSTKLPDGVKYIKGQLETGENTGYEHWQVLCALTKKQRLSGVKKIFGSQAHCEPSRSAAADAYVWKEETRVEGTQFEFGSKPMKRNSRPDWDLVRENAKRGKLEDIPGDIYVRCYNQLKRIEMDNLQMGEDSEKVVKVFYGSTGVGKSHKAHAEARAAEGGLYKKNPMNKWFNGYRGQENILIDEFFGAKSIGLNHLLVWLDQYACSVETKGGEVPFAGKRIWITSNLHPYEWYPDVHEEQKKALLRRMKVYKVVRQGNQVVTRLEE